MLLSLSSFALELDEVRHLWGRTGYAKFDFRVTEKNSEIWSIKIAKI